MLTANNVFKERIIARDALKGVGYTCPVCEGLVILKRGAIKIAHFSHKYLGECWWENESPEHLGFKQKLYDSYTGLGYKCELEKVIADHKFVLDLFVDYKGAKVAIEVQLSEDSWEHILEKTKALNELGYYVLWLVGDPALKTESERSSLLLYLMHAGFYFGRVYTITKNFTIKSNWGVSIDPEMEISALYFKYRTKTIIDKKHYLPITNLNLLLTEAVLPKSGTKIKIARFFDKHKDKEEIFD